MKYEQIIMHHWVTPQSICKLQDALMQCQDIEGRPSFTSDQIDAILVDAINRARRGSCLFCRSISSLVFVKGMDSGYWRCEPPCKEAANR